MAGTPVCAITTAGIARPTFADCLAYTQGMMRALYGADVYLGADSQDGQLCVAWAQSLHDVNGETVAAYNAFSPSSAQGEGLSRVVKINGIRRKTPTASTCDFLLVGQAYTAITAGVLRDEAGHDWRLGDVLIPAAGQVTVTGTCADLGAITLTAGGIDTVNERGSIANPTRGWQSAVNLIPAVPGLPVEQDSVLRQRQTISTALPSRSLLEGLLAATAAVSGVARQRAYENDGNVTDRNGLPGHSIALVIEGGDSASIAALIQRKKGGGLGTYGSLRVPITDAAGIPRVVAFSRPRLVPITYAFTVRPLRGYSLDTATALANGLATWTSTLGIGNPLLLSRAYGPILAQGDTFELIQGSLRASRDGMPLDVADIATAFDEAFVGDPTLVSIATTS